MMFDGPCQPGNWGFLGESSVWGWIGLILNLVLWVGLIAGLIVFVLWAIRRARVPATTGELTAKEILQARYARGEITREKYELKKQVIG